MNDDKSKKLLPRWKKGGQRNRKEDAKILAKIQPVAGWRNGARVQKV